MLEVIDLGGRMFGYSMADIRQYYGDARLFRPEHVYRIAAYGAGTGHYLWANGCDQYGAW